MFSKCVYIKKENFWFRQGREIWKTPSLVKCVQIGLIFTNTVGKRIKKNRTKQKIKNRTKQKMAHMVSQL